jgi:Ala-tRNA(Pro) deacylase
VTGPGAAPWTPEAVLAELDALGIAYEMLDHPPVHTVEAAREHWARLSGEAAKNLLLKDAGGRLWLVVAPAEAPVDLKALPKRIGSKRLSFSRPPDLAATLAVEGGSVTPLAVVNDRAGRVTVVLDPSLAGEARVKVHPLVNTATVAVAGHDLVRFLDRHGHAPVVVALDGAIG